MDKAEELGQVWMKGMTAEIAQRFCANARP